jgi:hypothetical protein
MIALSAVALAGAMLMAALAWLRMSALHAYGPICGAGADVAHCQACYAAVALSMLGLSFLALARAARRPLATHP